MLARALLTCSLPPPALAQYKGVRKIRQKGGSRYYARGPHLPGENGASLGGYGTAVEAAVAYARHVLETGGEEPQEQEEAGEEEGEEEEGEEEGEEEEQ